MSFLQPILLLGLPLALLPIIIHLINQHRHRTVNWAATMFLLEAKKLTKGIAHIRQLLILALRVLAILLLIVAASRPLSGGWLSLTGGQADTTLILLDRSASMEQQFLDTGESKRSASLAKLTQLLEKTSKRSHVVLIDSVTLEPTSLSTVTELGHLPQAMPTATHANIPALLQRAVEFLNADESGRTDIWIASDLRQADWETHSGKWPLVRNELSRLDTTRLFLLTFPENQSDNLSISVTQVRKQSSSEGDQLVFDLHIARHSKNENDLTVPLELNINGTRTVQDLTLKGSEMTQLGKVVPLGENQERGWGSLSLPADGNLADNTAYFAFDDPAPRKTIIISDDLITANAIKAATTSPVDPAASYHAEILSPNQLGRIPWKESALICWQAPIPKPSSPVAKLLTQHLESGRSLIFLPPLSSPRGEPESLFEFSWGDWNQSTDAFPIQWWRHQSGILSNTRSGEPLPVNELKIFQYRNLLGNAQPLLKGGNDTMLIARLTTNARGAAYAWGTLPRPDYSTLASEGIVFFVMIHRALSAGANAAAAAQSQTTRLLPLEESNSFSLLDFSNLSPLSQATDTQAMQLHSLGLIPSIAEASHSDKNRTLVAFNRPLDEDDHRVVDTETLEALLEGIPYRIIKDELNSNSALTSEIWRIFLIIMTLALLAEAILCLPPKELGDC